MEQGKGMCRMNQEIINIMPVRMKKELIHCQALGEAQEIRVRIGRRIHIITEREDYEVVSGAIPDLITAADIREITESISGYSLFACEEELKNGYITLRGGHRIGIAGEVVSEGGKIKTIKNISSFNIRVSHQVRGSADELMPYIDKCKNLLLISPPRKGKTTLLRDILRQLSDRPMENVAIVDERSEIASCYHGRPENDVGERTDVLDNCPKAEGMMMLLRSMSPTIIGVDEIGKREDVEAVLRVVNCGVRVIATIHGENPGQIRQKAVFRELFEQKIFDCCILLKSRNYIIYNAECLETGTVVRKRGV